MGMFSGTRAGWRLLGAVGHYTDFTDDDGNPLTATRVTGYDYDETNTFAVAFGTGNYGADYCPG